VELSQNTLLTTTLDIVDQALFGSRAIAGVIEQERPAHRRGAGDDCQTIVRFSLFFPRSPSRQLLICFVC